MTDYADTALNNLGLTLTAASLAKNLRASRAAVQSSESREVIATIIDELRAALLAANEEIERWKKEADLAIHQCLTCGVAATHPDANLTRTGAYIGKWDSPQAESVRKLRDERDSLRADLAAKERAVELAMNQWRLDFMRAEKAEAALLAANEEIERWKARLADAESSERVLNNLLEQR